MNIQKLKLLLATACLAPLPLTAQITERERPAEWKHLITGGRYMDRFDSALMAIPAAVVYLYALTMF